MNLEALTVRNGDTETWNTIERLVLQGFTHTGKIVRIAVNTPFEGDIVEVYDFTSAYASKYRGVVKMYRGSWCVEYEDSIFDTVFHPMLFFDDFADRKTEIISNIYDNPELLSAH